MKQSNSSKHTATLSNRGFYTILSICGIIIAVSAWVLWSSARSKPAEEPQASLTTPVIVPAGSMPDLTEDEPIKEKASEPEPSQKADAPATAAGDGVAAVNGTAVEEKATVETSKPAKTETAVEPEPVPSAPVYVRPVSGTVITPFSGDELLYQPTLGDWRVHTGTDISADPGETVLALTDGTVQEITQDDMYGACVTISHPSELVTTYRGLDELRVSAGQAVSAGEAIGSCAETIASEAAIGTHVHLEASLSGKMIDVLSLLGEDEIE